MKLIMLKLKRKIQKTDELLKIVGNKGETNLNNRNDNQKDKQTQNFVQLYVSKEEVGI